jgi:hypothetical protein
VDRIEITVEIDGKTYSGSYDVSGRVVTTYFAGGRKATQVGGSRAELVAKSLLRELIREAKTRMAGRDSSHG